MQTECTPDLFGFAPVEGHEVVAAFDGGAMTSDAGALLLGETDRSIGMMRRFAACFHDVRQQDLIEHDVVTLVGQRVGKMSRVWDWKSWSDVEFNIFPEAFYRCRFLPTAGARRCAERGRPAA